MKVLIEKIRSTLSLEEFFLNARIFGTFLLGRRKELDFDLKSIEVKQLFESDEMKIKVLRSSYRELGMNKSTLWYQKRRLMKTGNLRIYRNTRQYYA